MARAPAGAAIGWHCGLDSIEVTTFASRTRRRVRSATSSFRTLSIDQKFHQQLSNETKGYFWAPLHRAPPSGQWVLHTTRQTAPVVPYRSAVGPPIANIQPLRLRAGTLGLSLRRTLDMLP